MLEDKEGYVLFTVVVLSKFYEPFKSACHKLRYNVREFNVEALDEELVTIEDQIAALEVFLLILHSFPLSYFLLPDMVPSRSSPSLSPLLYDVSIALKVTFIPD